jgi:2-hydroxy-6-oxonona-2,4-dienedioate hydrolase
VTAVVFVHGLMGGSAQWDGQFSALDGFDIVTLDLPGFGKNAHMDTLNSITAFANWALDTLTTQGIARFHLVGHSMGGMVAQEMAALAPERLKRLVLYGTGATGVLPGRFETIATSKSRTCADGPNATARRISATWFLDREKAMAFEGCARIAELSGIDAILAGLDAMNGWSGVDKLEHITAPTMVVWGDHDRTYPWRQTQELWQKIRHARLAVIPGCAHAAHLEKPTLFNAILNDFLTEQSQA